LAEIYASINKLETTEIEELKFYDYDEKFRPFIWFAGFLLLLELALRNTVLKVLYKIPIPPPEGKELKLELE
jgi:Ca-activated chloride channel family protein